MGTTSSFMDYGGYEKGRSKHKTRSHVGPHTQCSPPHTLLGTCLAPIACVPYSPSRDSLLPHSLSVSSHTNSHTSPSHVIPSLPSTCGAPFPPSTPVLRHRGEHRVLDVDFLLERYKWFDSDLSRLSRRDKVRMVQSKRSSKERQPYARKRRPTYRTKLHLQSKETAVRP